MKHILFVVATLLLAPLAASAADLKKATKPNPMTGVTGGIIDKLMPIHVSNVALFNAATGKADRVGYKDVDGKKVRVFKSSGEVVKV